MSLLKWAFFFFVLAVIAGLLGFSGIRRQGLPTSRRCCFSSSWSIFAVVGILAVTAFRAVT